MRLVIIGITGSIGSGKTTVSNLFKKYGFKVINADKIGHQIIKKSSIAYKEIVENFGNKILDKNKNIDRKKLGNVVFDDFKRLVKLNSIMHSIIIDYIKNSIKKIKNKNQKTKIIIDAPLLLETETKDLVDKIVIIKTDKKNILERLSEKYSEQKIEKILNAQIPLYEKLKYADFVIDNNKDLEHLKNQVKNIIKK